MVECPICEQHASKTVQIKMGNSWRDTFGKPPHSFFSDYLMVHVAPGRRGRVAFLHSEKDLQQGMP